MQLLLLTCVTLLPSSSAMTVAESERPSGVKIWVMPALVPQMPMATSAAGMAGFVAVIAAKGSSARVLQVVQHACCTHCGSFTRIACLMQPAEEAACPL